MLKPKKSGVGVRSRAQRYTFVARRAPLQVQQQASLDGPTYSLCTLSNFLGYADVQIHAILKICGSVKCYLYT